jgi:hypothetical protein
MTNITYYLDTPVSGNKPSVDQPKMKINTNAVNTILNVDHFGFNSNPGGFHSQCTLQQQSGVPATAQSGFTTLFSNIVSSQGELFFVRGTDPKIQLTGPFNPTGAATGKTFLPGGFLLQWAKVSSISNGTVTFATAFPANCYGVWTNPYWTGTITPGGVAGVSIKSLSTTSFIWVFNTNSSNYTGGGFYWIAIGN